MAAAFEQWNARIEATVEPADRRALLAEVARFRAQHLGDVAASREATFAMSRLHRLLGEEDAAVREARALLSLCQTAPRASDEQVSTASRWLAELGEPVPDLGVGARPSRREKRQERERPERTSATREAQAEQKASASPRGAKALELASKGDFGAALRSLKGRRGPEMDLLRAWLQLSRALSNEDPARRERDLQDLHRRLGELVGAERAPEGAPRAERPDQERPLPDDPLSQVLGQPAPRRRERRIEVIERWVAEHPDRVDEIAAAALEHHVLTAGLKAPAPWLAGVVGLALARGGQATRQTVDRLRSQEAFAVTAYDEPPFARLVDLLGSALERGWEAGGLRRGVLARDEPAERKLWTLRLTRGGVERMLVVGPSVDEPYPEGLAARLAQRLTRLCPRIVLFAPGAGNAALREAAAALGLRAFAEDPGEEALLAALEEARPVEAVEARPAPAAKPAQEAPAEEGPRPDALLTEALEAGAPASELLPIVQQFRRRFRAIQVGERVLGTRPDDARVVALLQAVHEAATPDEALPEGTTLAVRAAAMGGEASRQALTDPPLSERFGGPGVDVVMDLARELAQDDWEIFRVLRGPTRREQRDHPVLDTLSEHLTGVWRLLVRRGEQRGEVWYIAELPIEGRAALPQLLLEERHRAVVLPIEPELTHWYGSLRGPEAIGWTGEEGDALRSEVAAWPAGGEAAGE